MTGKYWDRPLSLVDGCPPCSPGCDHCWSMAMGKRFHKWPDVPVMRFDRLEIPMKVKRPTVFSIWNDLAHEEITLGFFGEVIGKIANYPQHTFLVLTKRPDQLKDFMNIMCFEWRNLPNLWLGVTVCNQQEADEKIPLLLATPAAHRWISIEPMLGPVDLDIIIIKEGPHSVRHFSSLECDVDVEDDTHFHGAVIEAVVLGGETGPSSRPMHPDWVRFVRDQCQSASVPFFFKQWGEWAPATEDYGVIGSVMPESDRKFTWIGHDGKTKSPSSHGLKNAFAMAHSVHARTFRLLDGREHNDLPWRQEEQTT